MNKLKLVMLFFAVAMVFVQCSTNKKLSTETAKKEEVAKPNNEQLIAILNEKYTPAQISEGKVLYESSCKKCHELHAPESRNIASWEYVLPKMVVRTTLGKGEVGKLRAYVLTHANNKM